jgi:hypothetical protein
VDKRWDDIIGAAGLLAATFAFAWAASAWFALARHGAEPAAEAPMDRFAAGAPAAAPPPAGLLQARDPGAAAPQAPGACAFDPILPAGSPGDGTWRVDAAPAPDLRPRAYVAAAREALDDGRPRDAEVALIVACRLAARAGTPRSVPVASIQARLGQLYAAAGAQGLEEPVPGEAMERARLLLQRSVSSMTAVLGPQASRTRVVAERLAALDAPRELAPPQAMALDAAAGVEMVAGAGDAPAREQPAPLQVAATAGEDPNLVQLDVDLARLRAQARAVSADPEGFSRRMAQAQSRRAACGDADCLRRWYAERRRELISEFSPRRGS